MMKKTTREKRLDDEVNGLRIEIRNLRQKIEKLEEEIKRLESLAFPVGRQPPYIPNQPYVEPSNPWTPRPQITWKDGPIKNY